MYYLSTRNSDCKVTAAQAIAPVSYTHLDVYKRQGHTVAVKAVDGVKEALSMTIPLGTSIHRRMVYIELKDGYNFDEVAAKIKADAYFVNDETHVIQVDSVADVLDMGHGVNLKMCIRDSYLSDREHGVYSKGGCPHRFEQHSDAYAENG